MNSNNIPFFTIFIPNLIILTLAIFICWTILIASKRSSQLSLNQEIWKINSFNRESKGRSLRSYRHFLHLTTTSLPVPPPYLPYWCKNFALSWLKFISPYKRKSRNEYILTLWSWLNKICFVSGSCPKPYNHLCWFTNDYFIWEHVQIWFSLLYSNAISYHLN